MSVTGLTVINISETYSVFGLFVLMFVFQFGGIGVMSLGTFVWLLIGKKIGLKGRQLIMVDHNQTNLSGLVALMIEIIKDHVSDRNHWGLDFRLLFFKRIIQRYKKRFFMDYLQLLVQQRMPDLILQVLH